jgi:hypothetical protein
MMDQKRRLAALGKFKSSQSHILVSTDVSSRGLVRRVMHCLCAACTVRLRVKFRCLRECVQACARAWAGAPCADGLSAAARPLVHRRTSLTLTWWSTTTCRGSPQTTCTGQLHLDNAVVAATVKALYLYGTRMHAAACRLCHRHELASTCSHEHIGIIPRCSARAHLCTLRTRLTFISIAAFMLLPLFVPVSGSDVPHVLVVAAMPSAL